MEESEKPSFENFLSKPTTLTDHLMWQLGSLHVNEDVYRAAELVIGNLNEEGYLTATDDELLGLADEQQAASFDAEAPESSATTTEAPDQVIATALPAESGWEPQISDYNVAVAEEESLVSEAQGQEVGPEIHRTTLVPPRTMPARVPFSRDALREAIDQVRQMDPIAVSYTHLRAHETVLD